MASTWDTAPVLVYGPRKAGTTLLQNLLDGASDGLFMVPGEMKLKYTYLDAALSPAARVQRHFQVGRSLSRDNRELFGRLLKKNGASRDGAEPPPPLRLPSLDPDRSRRALNAEKLLSSVAKLFELPPTTQASLYSNEAAAYRDAAVKAAKAGPADRWASKEVSNPAEAVLSHFLSTFPEGQVVMLGRDPRYVVRSIIRDRQRRGRTLKTAQVARECREVHRFLECFARVPTESRVHRVLYERLVGDTEGTMKRVAAFLRIPFGERLLTPSVLGEPVVVGTASQPRSEVFQSEADWTEGLSRGEQWTVRAALQTLKRLSGGGAVDYRALQESIS